MAHIPGLDLYSDEDNEDDVDLDIVNKSCSLNTKKIYVGSRSQNEFNELEKITLYTPVFFAKAMDLKKKEEVTILAYDTPEEEEGCELQDILKEVEIIRKLKHLNVLEFYEIAYGIDFKNVGFVYEPCSITLSKIMGERVDMLHEIYIIKNIMLQLFSALNYIHKNCIMHRDVHPDNLFLTAQGFLKLGNFRNACTLNQISGKIKTIEFRYQPVELLLESEICGTPVDIWSANCILAHLLLKKPIFPDREREKVLSFIFRILGFPTEEIWEGFYKLPEYQYLSNFNFHKYNCLDLVFKRNPSTVDVTPTAMDLLHWNFQYNPKNRLTAEESLAHPFFLEEPQACPNAEILTVMECVNISRQLRKFKDNKQV